MGGTHRLVCILPFLLCLRTEPYWYELFLVLVTKCHRLFFDGQCHLVSNAHPTFCNSGYFLALSICIFLLANDLGRQIGKVLAMP